MKDIDVLKRIISKRKELGFNQSQMAKRLKVSPATYQKTESGVSKLTVERLIEISKTLEVNPSFFLFTEVERKHPVLNHPDINSELKKQVLEYQDDVRVLDFSADLLIKNNSQLKIIIKHQQMASKSVLEMAKTIYSSLDAVFISRKDHQKEMYKILLMRMGLAVTDDNVSAFMNVNDAGFNLISGTLKAYKPIIKTIENIVETDYGLEDKVEV